MPVTLTSDKPVYEYLEAGALSLAGAAPETRYTVRIKNPDGHVRHVTVLTDSDGQARIGVVAQLRGPFDAEVRLAAEHTGQTDPAATLNVKGK